MTTRVNISEAERLVISALWDHGPMSAEEVANEVGEQNDWTLTTTKTLLGRLLKKNAIAARREGRHFVYSASLSRQNYLRSESLRFVDRLFDGRVAPLVSYFSQAQQLTPEDVVALRKLLDELP